jgi:hypothetical protein
MLATTSGDGTGDGEIGAALRLGEQSGPDFFTTFVVTKIKVWSLLRDTALTSRVSLLARSLNQ